MKRGKFKIIFPVRSFIFVFILISTVDNFTNEPKSHGCKPADEWFSVQDSTPRNPENKSATAACPVRTLVSYRVKPWGSTYEHPLNQTVRMVRGVGGMDIRVENYEVIEKAALEDLRERFPTDPDEGEWKDVATPATYWITLPEDCQGQLEAIKEFVAENGGQYTDVVTVGMGGSSRPTDVVSMFQEELQASGANTHVLETLDEDSIRNLLSSLNLDRTLFIIISKSGSTAETIALSKLVSYRGGDFIAITTKTDENGSPRDSKLMQFLEEQDVDLDEVQDHPEKVGGRYTFFSNIGMLPAVLAGINIDILLAEAQKAMESDIKYKLGQFMTDMEDEGRIYMRIILPDKLAKLGLWIEQLVAESSGKHDEGGNERGIIAITERDFDTSVYKRDDVFAVRIKMGEEDVRDSFTQQIVDAGTPLFEFQINYIMQSAGAMYSVEFATGMAGITMNVDSFNQPGVEAKKQLTREMKDEMRQLIEEDEMDTKEAFDEMLDRYQTDYRVEIANGVTLDFGDFVQVLETEHNIDFEDYMQRKDLDINDASDVYRAILMVGKEVGKTYSALLPYNETYKDHSVWAKARGSMRKLGLVDVFGVGPVYEHSYSQFFHQGPNKGILTFITSTHPGEIQIPGDAVEGITFAMQNTLQAFGAMKAEVENDIPRLTVRIEINGKFSPQSMNLLETFFTEVEEENEFD